MVQDDKCLFCPQDETNSHLFFYCKELMGIWQHILDWIQIHHVPLDWKYERDWLSHNYKGKGWRASILKCAVTEAIYAIWSLRNDRVFSNDTNSPKHQQIEINIIDTIVYRIWENKKYRSKIATLML